MKCADVCRTNRCLGYATALVTLTILLTGCAGGSGDSSDSSASSVAPSADAVPARSNAAPIARIAGPSVTSYVRPGETVVLDGGSSYDPDGDGLRYHWTLASAPAGSQSNLADDSASQTTVVADVPGEYVVQLVASDPTDESKPAELVITVAEPARSAFNWGLYHELNVGEDPGIAVNNDGVVVEVDESPTAYDLWYRVGVIRGGLIEWGGSQRFETGIKPDVALDDYGVVVITYTNRSGLNVYYKVGIVDRDARTIHLGVEQEVETGSRPSVAVNNHSQAIVVYGDSICEPVTGIGCRLWSRVGSVDAASRRIDWGPEEEYDTNGGLFPAVALADDGTVLEVHESQNNDGLWYWSGHLNGSRWTRWRHGRYGFGEAPDVALNNLGRVVVVHEHATAITLYSALGRLEDGYLQLRDSFAFSARGQVPVVDVNDSDQFVAAQDYGDTSALPTSHVLAYLTTDFEPGLNYATWMENTRAVGYKTLRDLMLPGTHDSAAYWLDAGGPGTAEQMRGPDWVGFEQACNGIEEGWLGDVLKFLCVSELATAAPYVQNNVAEGITLAHSMSLREQLEHGIRFFDLRVTYRDPAKFEFLPGYRAYHGLVGNSIETVAGDIRAYMESVNAELVVLQISHLAVGTHEQFDWRIFTHAEHDGLIRLLLDELGPYVLPRNGATVDELLSTPIRKLVAHGPRIILQYNVHTTDDYAISDPDNPYAQYLWPALTTGGFTNTIDLAYQETGIDKGEKPGPEDDVREGQRLLFDDFLTSEPPRKLFVLYQTLTANAEIATQNAVNLLGPFRPTLHILSQDVNQHLATFLAESDPFFPNVVLVDFPEESDVVARAIEISGRCNETAITGQIAVVPPRQWPPNHSMVSIAVDVSELLSANPESFRASIASIEAVEPDRKSGKNIYSANSFEPDSTITGRLTAQIRAERDARATGRTYWVTVEASDCSGDYLFKGSVEVPHNVSN